MQGALFWVRGLEVGYYAQTRQNLNPNLSVLEEIWSLTPSVPEEEIRNFLGAFLFSGDDVERETGSLSGGEQSRVALAKLMRLPLNLLVLDEPPTIWISLPAMCSKTRWRLFRER